MKFYTESTFSLESLKKLVILHCFDFESSQNLLLLGYDGQEPTKLHVVTNLNWEMGYSSGYYVLQSYQWGGLR